MKFVGLDGLKHFWAKAKSWIAEQITTEVTAKIAEIVANAPEDLDTLKEIADWINTHEDSASAMNTEILANTEAISGKADKGHTHTKSQITDFPTSLPANGGKSAKSSFLDEYVGAGGTRPTSGNIIPKDATEYGGMRKDVVTSSMADSGHPGQDGHLLTMFWDNSGRYDSQFFVSNERQPATVKVRVKTNEADYGPWTDIITSDNIGSQTVAKASTAGTADTAKEGLFGVLGGARMANSTNFNDLLNNELANGSGLMGGSILTKESSLGISAGWWNFLYIPHRTGAVDGDDNRQYGTLIVTSLDSNDGAFYIIHRMNGKNYTSHVFYSAT